MDSRFRGNDVNVGLTSLVDRGPSSLVRVALALGELGGAAGFVQADLLALDFAGVAGHETGFAQRALERFVVFDQGAGDTEADRAGLAGDAAAFDGDEDVELVALLVSSSGWRTTMRAVSRLKKLSSGLPLTTMLPLPGRRNTRAAADLRRPVP
jgi:hypothetical protein